MDYEHIVMQLIMHGGDARSKSLLALSKAKEGELIQARHLLEKADLEINAAHEVQTHLIQAEVRGENPIILTLLMVHAQDHLMNAMTVRDLSRAILELMEES